MRRSWRALPALVACLLLALATAPAEAAAIDVKTTPVPLDPRDASLIDRASGNSGTSSAIASAGNALMRVSVGSGPITSPEKVPITSSGPPIVRHGSGGVP